MSLRPDSDGDMSILVFGEGEIHHRWISGESLQKLQPWLQSAEFESWKVFQGKDSPARPNSIFLVIGETLAETIYFGHISNSFPKTCVETCCAKFRCSGERPSEPFTSDTAPYLISSCEDIQSGHYTVPLPVVFEVKPSQPLEVLSKKWHEAAEAIMKTAFEPTEYFF